MTEKYDNHRTFSRYNKSNLMQVYIDYLKENFEDANIIFIGYMDLDFEEIKEYHRKVY